MSSKKHKTKQNQANPSAPAVNAEQTDAKTDEKSSQSLEELAAEVDRADTLKDSKTQKIEMPAAPAKREPSLQPLKQPKPREIKREPVPPRPGQRR